MTDRRTVLLAAAAIIVALALGIAGALFIPGPRWDEAKAHCRELYAAALTGRDTTRVDLARAFTGVRVRRTGMTCGDLRRAGELAP